MPSKPPPYPRTFRLKVAGKIHVATYDVEDGCVQVTHEGRRSTWTVLGAARAEDVAKALLKELLAVLLAVVCLNALAQRLDDARTAAAALEVALAISLPTILGDPPRAPG